jgi:Kef-type K+ transport system membrane component KefB
MGASLSVNFIATLVVSYYVGRLFKLLQLPAISGYLIVGVLCGPHGLQLLSAELTRSVPPEALAGSASLAVQAAVACGQPLSGCYWHRCRL